MLERMTTSVVVLGAGFGGLELSSRLADALGDDVEVTLIDRSDAFVFGFSKLDMMFGRATPESIRVYYKDLVKPHVRFRQETITAIDPVTRRVTTDLGTYDADVMVIALGADYDLSATPGLGEFGNEFYSVPGAEVVRGVLSAFKGGEAIVGVCGAPFKCPPAPSEAAILLDEFLREHGVREAASVKLVMPFGIPVPPSPETSDALLANFAERGIEFVPGHVVASLEAGEVILDDGQRLSCDLFLGIPVHRVPEVVVLSGLTEDGWIPVDPSTLATRFPGVYAVGDVTSVGTAKAGVFSEGAARVVADQLIARLRGEPEPPGYDGCASCYIEFGNREVARIDVDFFSIPGQPLGTFYPPSTATTAEKSEFAAERRTRWLGTEPVA
jgi:sulfide:quinone oxidoreductase